TPHRQIVKRGLRRRGQQHRRPEMCRENLQRVQDRHELPPEPWRTPLCGSVGRSGLVVDRGLHATGTVATSSIIEVDDPFHNSLLRFFPGFEMMPGEYLVFQC